MPVKTVKCDATMRCLELRLSFSDPKHPPCTVAFRTDDDRQGVWRCSVLATSDDHRTPMLLGSLLSGLAAKLRFYCHPNISGFTATVRRMNAFVASRGYPRSWWVYDFAIALLRNGVPLPCLPTSTRKFLNAQKERARVVNS